MRNSLLLLLALVLIPGGLYPPPAVAASLRRACRLQCTATIDDCWRHGTRRRICRQQTLRRCRLEGLAVCLPPTEVTSTTTLPPPPGTTTTSSTQPRPATTTTTSSTVTTTSTTLPPPTDLSAILGTWDFTFRIISTFTFRYRLDSVLFDPDLGVSFVAGRDGVGGPVVAARPIDFGSSLGFGFALLDPGPVLCDFYLFDLTSSTALVGIHLATGVTFDGRCEGFLNLNDPNSLVGARISFATRTDARDAAQGVSRAPGTAADLERLLSTLEVE